MRATRSWTKISLTLPVFFMGEVIVCECGLAVGEVQISGGLHFYCRPIAAIWPKEAPNRRGILLPSLWAGTRLVYDSFVSLLTYVESTRHINVERTEIVSAKPSYKHTLGGCGGGQQCTLAIITPEWIPPCSGFNSTSSWETRRSEEVDLYKVLYSHPIKHSRLRNPVVIFT